FGPDHPITAALVDSLGVLYKAQGRYAEAEPLYKRSLATWEKAVGPADPNLAKALENYAALLRETGRGAEAFEMGARAIAIRAKRAKANP
ncbi:MAG: tetratricopeptide repeat protein, partial [Kiloniellales bacterium]